MNTLSTKLCKSCGSEKPLSEFYRNPTMGDGFMSHCKDCKRSYSRQYHHQKRDVLLPLMRDRYAKNIEQRRAQKKIYTAAHKDEQRLRHRFWTEANRAYVNAKNRAWVSKNLPKKAEQCRRRYAMKKGAPGAHTSEQILTLAAHQKGVCANCFGTLVKYHVDHIMPITKGGSNDIGNIQLLCRSCNSRKSARMPWVFNMQSWLEMSKG